MYMYVMLGEFRIEVKVSFTTKSPQYSSKDSEKPQQLFHKALQYLN